MEDIEQEKRVRNAIEPLSIEKMGKIIKQMKTCVCKIYNKGSTGTGFFAKIPYKNEIIRVLITNHHVLGENEIKDNKRIIYIINNNEDDKKSIKIDGNRIKYTDEKLDITIIEIKEDKDGIHDYIEIDDDIIKYMDYSKEEIIESYKNIYNNESIYILNYMNGEKILVSYGLISEINEDNGINHKCNTDGGSSGSPILSLKNNKLIGVHYGSSKRNEYNYGTLIIYAIIEFNKIEKKSEIINEIKQKMTDEISNINIIIKNDDNKKLLEKEFLENNKNNCKIIIGNKEQKIIEEYMDINEIGGINIKNEKVSLIIYIVFSII